MGRAKRRGMAWTVMAKPAPGRMGSRSAVIGEWNSDLGNKRDTSGEKT